MLLAGPTSFIGTCLAWHFPVGSSTLSIHCVSHDGISMYIPPFTKSNHLLCQLSNLVWVKRSNKNQVKFNSPVFFWFSSCIVPVFIEQPGFYLSPFGQPTWSTCPWSSPGVQPNQLSWAPMLREGTGWEMERGNNLGSSWDRIWVSLSCLVCFLMFLLEGTFPITFLFWSQMLE